MKLLLPLQPQIDNMNQQDVYKNIAEQRPQAELSNLMFIKTLVKVSTYAKRKKLSTTQIYNQIIDKKIECVIIDGVKFIKTK